MPKKPSKPVAVKVAAIPRVKVDRAARHKKQMAQKARKGMKVARGTARAKRRANVVKEAA